MWTNYHTHSTYCDGKSPFKELVDEAKRKKMWSLGFSSHAPLPFPTPWSMEREAFKNYCGEIAGLKKLGLGMEIYAGLEVDYIPAQISPSEFKPYLDYVIGSVHFVEKFSDGRGWEIDGPHALFKEGLMEIFKGNIKDAVARYQELTREMIMKSTPDVLGHLDKIKIQNGHGQTLFDETEPWYRDEMMKTISVIQSSGIIVEANTRGLYKKKSTNIYPSPWVLELLHRHQVPVTISSDAHHPIELTEGFSETAKLLKSIGFSRIKALQEGKWKSFEYNEHGILYH